MPILSGPIVQDAESSVEIENHQIGCQFWSVVRLYRFNDVPTILREWLDVPSAVIKMFIRSTDRECKVLLIGGRILSALKNGGVVNAAIKGRTELIEYLAQMEREDGIKGTIIWSDPHIPCPVVVHAYDRSIGVIFDKTVPRLGEGFAVSVCPFDSLPAPLEWSHDV